jgi:chromosome segregation ATPase
MPETKRKICVWVPTDMYDNVVSAGYDSPTVAVLKGFELLLGEEECRKNAGKMETFTAQLTSENSNLKNEIERLNQFLKQTPDPKELIDLKVRSEELEKLNETLKDEKQKVESNLNKEIEKLNIAMQNVPDPKDLIELRVRSEELQKHIETLKEERERAERDKEDLKVTYANYFSQIQTLINQKAIEAPGAKKPWWRFW